VVIFFYADFMCDAPRAWGLYFQNSASPQMEADVIHSFPISKSD
jgi:hypothetical protein